MLSVIEFGYTPYDLYSLIPSRVLLETPFFQLSSELTFPKFLSMKKESSREELTLVQSYVNVQVPPQPGKTFCRCQDKETL